MNLYRKAKRSAAAIFFEKERESVFKLLVTKKDSVYLVELCARSLKIGGGKLPPLLNGQLILLSVNKAKVGDLPIVVTVWKLFKALQNHLRV